MTEYEIVADSAKESEEDYPEHVKEKIQVYKNAKLKYKINEDGAMVRSIAFHRIKKIKPEMYYKTITMIMRLRSPDKSKEFLIYKTHEGAFDGGGKEHNDSILHGVSEIVHTQPVYDTVTGNLKDRTIDVHKNVFKIPFSKKTLQDILDSRIPRKFKNESGEEETEELEDPKMMIGILSTNYPELWQSGQNYGIKNINAFTNASFDELLLLSMTGEDTLAEAMKKGEHMLNQGYSQKNTEFNQHMKRVITTFKEEKIKK